jgi:hypothetical protein
VPTIAAFEEAFSTLGYVACDNGDFEEGREKIAFYAKDGVVKHAARQVNKTMWTSKLGDGWDIEHSRGAISGPEYGEIVSYMVRQALDPNVPGTPELAG